MKANRCRKKGGVQVAFMFVSVIAFLLLNFQAVLALPFGQQVVNGQATFNSQGNSLTIANSPTAIINWQGFSINTNEAVYFNQQNSASMVLNRVMGQDPSRILGLLQSNGRVFLINPNGILIGQGARIDVNGLVASALDISNHDFLVGKYNFISGSVAGSIQNQGTITTPEGGRVYLIAPNIENSGIINSPKGNVILAAGHSVQLVDSLDPDIAVVVSAPENRAVNIGQIIARSGRVGIYGGLISQKGMVNADSAIVGENGRIFLKATKDVTLDRGSMTSAGGLQGGQIKIQSEAGTTQMSGVVTAAGSDGKGGEIQILGNNICLNDNALVDVSGRAGGGTALIGGDYQGKNAAVQNAEATFIGPGAIIRADAMDLGAGGKIVLWSDDRTDFFGRISARGGLQGGDGGNVEVSGKRTLVYQGLTDLRAPQGNAGTLLLDPTNFFIIDPAPTDGITPADLVAQLNLANVTIQTQAIGAQNGDIFVEDDVTWTSANKLTLSAHDNIFMNAVITNNSGGSLALRADSDGSGAGNVVFAGSGHVTLTGGGTAAIFYNPPGGYTAPTDYLSFFTGVTPTASMLVNDVNNLQAILTNLAGTYALGKDIDAGITSTWNSGAGFVPLGNDDLANPVGNIFTGIFDGLGHTITGLYINRPSTNYVGLFGGSDGNAVFRNVGLIGVNITGGFQTGGLVAHTGGIISNAYTTGTVTGTDNTVGGLVGLSAGSTSDSYSTAAVSGVTYVGGLIGANYGTTSNVTRSYSTGTVSGSSSVGGLAGYNAGTITNSYWDTQTSGRSTSYGGTGKTTGEMKDQATFAGWDFTNIWNITQGATYPYLRWLLLSAGTPAANPAASASSAAAGATGNAMATGNTVVAFTSITNTANTIEAARDDPGQMGDEDKESGKRDGEDGQQKIDAKERDDRGRAYCN